MVAKKLFSFQQVAPVVNRQGARQYFCQGNQLLKLVLLDLCLLYFHKADAQSNPVQWADSCNSVSFYGKISSPGYSDFSQVHEYPGGDIITVGTVKDNFVQLAISRNYGNIMRISPEGDSLWSVFIGINDPAVQVDLRMYASIITSNGDIVVLTSINAASLSGNFVVRLNGSGVIKWQKRLPFIDPASPSEIFTEIMETADAGFFIAGSRPNEGVLLKIDKDGNLVWRNRLIGSDFKPNITAAAEGQNRFFVAGQGTVTASGYSGNYIAAANKISGDIEFIKWINFFGTTPLTGFTEYEYDHMNYHQGKLFVTGNTSLYYNGPDRNAQVAVELDEDGQALSAIRIENLDIETDPANMFHGSLYEPFSRTGVQFQYGASNSYYLYRLYADYAAQWSWQIPLSNLRAAMDSKVFSDSSFAVAGIDRNAGDIISANLLKTSSTGKLESCTNQPFPFVVAGQLISTSDVPNMLESPSGSQLTTTATLDIKPGTGYRWQLECNNIEQCRMSRIQGDTILCKGNNHTFLVRRSGSCNNPVQFSTSHTAAAVNATSDSTAAISFPVVGTYKIYAGMPSACGSLHDSVIVQVKEPATSFSLGPDTSICTGNSITLQAATGFAAYQWQDGSTHQSFHVQSPGNYSVTVTDACGHQFRDTISVAQAAPVVFSAGPDRVKCNADTIQLAATTGFTSYTWSPAYNTSNPQQREVLVNPLVDTSYRITAEKYPGCLVFDTINIHVLHSPPIELGNDTSICSNQALLLNAGAGFDNYNWNNNIHTTEILVAEPGQYFVTGYYNNGCHSTDTINISTDNCLDDLYVPNAFAPNGTNKIFKPLAALPLSKYRLQVYDRWGQLMFETDAINKGWSGKAGNRESDAGVYVWICTYQFKARPQKIKQGTVLLIR